MKFNVIIFTSLVITSSIFLILFLISQINLNRLGKQIENVGQLLDVPMYYNKNVRIYTIESKYPDCFSFTILNVKQLKVENIVIATNKLIDSLTLEEFISVIRHETAHIMTDDTKYYQIIRLIRQILRFDPFISKYAHSIEMDQEIHADDNSLILGNDRKTFANALFKLLNVANQMDYTSKINSTDLFMIKRIKRVLNI